MLEIGPRDFRGAAAQRHLVDHGDRRLGEDAERRHDDLELVGAEILHREERLVLPGDQHVADAALRERRRRAARARIEHRHVLIQLRDERLGRGGAAARLLQRPGPGREVVPARAARGLRVRRDHRHAGLRQVAPVLDALGIALAHQEHDRRGVRRAVVRQARLPVGRQQLALRRDRVDVVGERERDHVGRQAVDHRARLLARAAVRLADGDVLARLLLPVGRERLVVVVVQLARRVVGHVEQRVRRARRRGCQHRCGQRGERDSLQDPVHRHCHLSRQKPSAKRVRNTFSSSRSAPPAAPPSKLVCS